MAITNSEVPTARRMSSPAKTINAGTTKNPPPTPRKPVMSPTTAPANTDAVRLLRVAPNFTDAYLTTGIAEYLLGSLPFFVKWVVRFDEVSGDKNIAIQRLTNVAANGRCFGAFAKILLSIIHLREKQPKRAETLLAELARDYPENPLIRKELVKVRLLLPAGSY